MDSTSIMDKVHDQDIVVIEHVSAGKQPAIWYQDAVYSMSYVLPEIISRSVLYCAKEVTEKKKKTHAQPFPLEQETQPLP